MPEQFETSPQYNDQFTAVEKAAIIDVQTEERTSHRLRAAIAAGTMILTSALGANLTSSTPAEATPTIGTIDIDGDPSAYKSMTQSQKLQAAVSAAHRGVWNSSITQNSVRAFKNGAQKGVNYDEGDIRFTKDHVGILMHSSTLGSVTRGDRLCNRAVATLIYKQIQNHCRLNDGQRIPTVAKIASVMSPYRNRTGLMLEIKDKDATAAELSGIVDILTRNGYTDKNLVIESKYIRPLRILEGTDAEVHIANPIPDVPKVHVDSSSSNPPQANDYAGNVVDGVVLSYKGMENGLAANGNYVNDFRDKGMVVLPWFNNVTRTEIKRVIGQNASGFIANNPQLINRMR